MLKLIKNPLILTVDRSKIFLSAKLFVDMLFNSNYLEDRHGYFYSKRVDSSNAATIFIGKTTNASSMQFFS